MNRAPVAVLALLATPVYPEVTLTWELPTRLEYCVDSDPVLDRLEGTRIYRRVADVSADTTRWTDTGLTAGTYHYVLAGSIPAYAGEPRGTYWRGRTLWVYPRVCGGAAEPSPESNFP